MGQPIENLRCSAVICSFVDAMMASARMMRCDSAEPIDHTEYINQTAVVVGYYRRAESINSPANMVKSVFSCRCFIICRCDHGRENV
jgi:hypothetical protein